MKKTLLEVYALAVCFVTITCFAISLGVGIYDVIELNAPEFTMKSCDYEKHQTNENFSRNWDEEKRQKFSEERITKLREDSYQVAIEKEKRDAIQSLLQILIIISIDTIIFLIHWLIARKSRNSAAQTILL
jgi:hypothetical protein